MAIPRCTCGYTVFYDKVARSVLLRDRWRRVTGLGGFGATPFGLNMGGAGARSWGRFLVSITNGRLQTTCKSCHRVRREQPIGGGTPMGAWKSGRSVFVLLTDSVSAGCVFGRFQTDEVTYEVPARRAFIDAPHLVGAPLEQADILPADAVTADTVYRFTLPDGVTTSSYHFLLRDRCLDTLTSIDAMGGTLA